jgi:salicylate hydroxylase
MTAMHDQATNGSESGPLDVAVVGAGIVGIMLALGLAHRPGLRVTIYERAPQYPDIGAAFAFSAVGRESMQRLNPDVLEALMRVGMRDPSPTFQYWAGFGPKTKEEAEDPATGLMFEVPEGNLGFVACLRTQYLLELAKQLPEAGVVVNFGKQLVALEDAQGKPVVLSFADGSSAEADVGMFFFSLTL